MKCKRTGYISNVHEDGVIILLGVRQMVTCSRTKTTAKGQSSMHLWHLTQQHADKCRICVTVGERPPALSLPGNVEQEASSSRLLPVKTDTSFMKCAWRKALAPRFPRAHVELTILFTGFDKMFYRFGSVL